MDMNGSSDPLNEGSAKSKSQSNQDSPETPTVPRKPPGLSNAKRSHTDPTGSRQRQDPRPPRQIPPEIKEKWQKVFTRMVIQKRLQRILQEWYKTAGVPCERCASMKLTEDKFIIDEFAKHQRTKRSNDGESDRNFEDVLGPEGLELGPHNFKLGELKEIYSKRNDCSFCRLIVESLSGHLEKFLKEDTKNTEHIFYHQNVDCFIGWQIDGRIRTRDANNKVIERPCTRRLRLIFKGACWDDIFIVLMEKKNASRNLFLGRSLTHFKTDAALVQRWVKFCDQHHGDLCRPFTQGSPASKPFFGVIDVKEMCLTKLPPDGRYVALSYVWGGKGVWRFQTKTSNIKKLMAPGGLNEWHQGLPRTIQDAISLVIDLGERYLWVDALCIIQKSDRSWELNSRIMNIVYGNAYFTICAADGDNANAGLKGLHNSDHTQNKAVYNKDVRLMSTQPAENYIRHSHWNTRGWTFQERLLSPRTLIFADERMFFQCRCTARAVDIVTEDERAGWSIEFKDSPSLILQKLAQQPLLVYKQSLQLYMQRKLTFQKDILAAFTGIGNLVCDALDGDLIFGLPSSHFDWALLWEPRDAAVRRSQEENELFPSWSWCGWQKEVMEYKSDMLAGIEDNLHDWLMHRTWITWYIRDENFNLRLVWNGGRDRDKELNHVPRSSPKSEMIWKGYERPHTSSQDRYDKYGRRIKQGEEDFPRDKDFKLILEECPFDVEIVNDLEWHVPNSTEKDMPYLQFYTWSAFFRIREDKRCTYKNRDRKFRRYNIEDYKDDWCGTILLDFYWVSKRQPDLEDPMEFIAISEAKQFDHAEYDDWANYIPVERSESTWDLYYVLLIEYRSDIAYRVGLGKVYKEAFENSCRPEGKKWKEFILG